MKSNAERHKYIFIIFLILICFIDCRMGGFPQLPTAKDTVAAALNTEDFLIENFYAILYFSFSLVFSVTSVWFGARIKKRYAAGRAFVNAGIYLGVFILVSGVWVITDSTFFMAFSDRVNIDAVVLVSFVSFMIMPILFLKCAEQITNNKFLYILEILFDINTVIFLALVLLRVEKAVYLFSLAFHHILIFGVSAYFILRYLIKAIIKKSNTKISVIIVLLVFFLLIIFALTAFLLECINVYSVITSVALTLLIIAALKITMDTTYRFYEEKMQADFYKKMAYTDAMTGVYNRNAFDAHRYAFSGDETLCLIILDIDKLKKINDSMGHDVGDAVICAAADIIKNCFSSLGKCYRIGGDEFAVILKEQNEDELKSKLKILENSVDTYNLNANPKLSLSYGYAGGNLSAATTEELFDEADKNMYRYKKAKHECI